MRRIARPLGLGCVGLCLPEVSLSVLIPTGNDLGATCGRHEPTSAGRGTAVFGKDLSLSGVPVIMIVNPVTQHFGKRKS